MKSEVKTTTRSSFGCYFDDKPIFGNFRVAMVVGNSVFGAVTYFMVLNIR